MTSPAAAACGPRAPPPPTDPCARPNVSLIYDVPRPVLGANSGLSFRVCSTGCVRCAWVTTVEDAEAHGVWSDRICGIVTDKGPDGGELYCWAHDPPQMLGVTYRPVP